MSTIINQVITEFRVRGSGVQASMGSLAYGTSQWTRSIADATRQSEKLGALWRAFGTTMRYAIAGQVVFGMTRFISQLSEIQQQMGLISAIGTTSTGKPIVGQDLTDLMGDIRKGAIDSITPVQEYNDAVINLLSTIQDVPRDEITPMVTTISQAAKLAQVNAQDATQAFTTLSVAFGKKPSQESIRRTAQEFFILTKEAPGGVAAGQQIIQQMGTLAAVTRAAHGTPEDMFALLLGGLRGGIPPAQASRALQFFVQTLGFPGQQTKESRNALASVGITPTSNMTLKERVNAILKRAGALGVSGDLGQLMSIDESALPQGEDTPLSAGLLNQFGISGQGAVFLGSVFHRIHALRMALALSTQAEMGQLQQDFKTYEDAGMGIVSDADDLAKATKRFQDQQPLKQAAVALDSLRTEIEQQLLAPLINPLAKGLTGVSSAAVAHPDATRAIVGGGLLLGGLLGGRRFLRGLGGAGVPTLAAAQSLATGDRQLGTITNPMFVVIVGDMSHIFSPGGIWRKPATYGPKTAGEAGVEAEKAAAKGRFGRLVGRLGPLGGFAFGPEGAILTGAAFEAYNFNQWAMKDDDPLKQYSGSKGWGELKRDIHGGPSGIEIAKKAGHLIGRLFGGGGDDDNKRKQSRAFSDLVKANNARSPQDMFWAGGGHSTDPDVLFGPGGKDKKELTLNINLKHPDGTTTKKKVHLPVRQWQNGKAPSRQGKAGKSRGV